MRQTHYVVHLPPLDLARLIHAAQSTLSGAGLPWFTFVTRDAMPAYVERWPSGYSVYIGQPIGLHRAPLPDNDIISDQPEEATA